MDKEVFLWLFGFVITGLIGLFVFLVKSHFAVENRLTKVETFLQMFSETAAKVLHSPHTPDLDRLLEKYMDRNYELSNDEWGELRNICEEVENDANESKGSQAMAGWMKNVARHKLALPPEKMRKHE